MSDPTKLRWTLLPWEALQEVARAIDMGAREEGREPYDWQRKTPDAYQDAMMRHVYAYLTGEPEDEKTKLHPLAHAGANLLMLLWFDMREARKL